MRNKLFNIPVRPSFCNDVEYLYGINCDTNSSAEAKKINQERGIGSLATDSTKKANDKIVLYPNIQSSTQGSYTVRYPEFVGHLKSVSTMDKYQCEIYSSCEQERGFLKIREMFNREVYEKYPNNISNPTSVTTPSPTPTSEPLVEPSLEQSADTLNDSIQEFQQAIADYGLDQDLSKYILESKLVKLNLDSWLRNRYPKSNFITDSGNIDDSYNQFIELMKPKANDALNINRKDQGCDSNGDNCVFGKAVVKEVGGVVGGAFNNAVSSVTGLFGFAADIGMNAWNASTSSGSKQQQAIDGLGNNLKTGALITYSAATSSVGCAIGLAAGPLGCAAGAYTLNKMGSYALEAGQKGNYNPFESGKQSLFCGADDASLGTCIGNTGVDVLSAGLFPRASNAIKNVVSGIVNLPPLKQKVKALPKTCLFSDSDLEIYRLEEYGNITFPSNASNGCPDLNAVKVASGKSVNLNKSSSRTYVSNFLNDSPSFIKGLFKEGSLVSKSGKKLSIDHVIPPGILLKKTNQSKIDTPTVAQFYSELGIADVNQSRNLRAIDQKLNEKLSNIWQEKISGHEGQLNSQGLKQIFIESESEIAEFEKANQGDFSTIDSYITNDSIFRNVGKGVTTLPIIEE